MTGSAPGIDGGRPFDWGRASPDYARFRDVYPPSFYDRLAAIGIGRAGSRTLDLGTGTGVVPRGLYGRGGSFVGVDASPAQVEAARALAARGGMDIDFRPCPAEEMDFPPASFDFVTACQCLLYFDKARTMPAVARSLKPGGRFAVTWMAWLPREDPVAALSESLVLEFNPAWTGSGYARQAVGEEGLEDFGFELEEAFAWDEALPFAREAWAGRVRACRGIGAALDPTRVAAFDARHSIELERRFPGEFPVLHHIRVSVYTSAR